MIDTKKALDELRIINSTEELENRFQNYLGKKGILNEEFKNMVSLDEEAKKEAGKLLSDAKKILTDEYNTKETQISTNIINEKLNQDIVDISLPGNDIEKGHFSLISKVRRDIEEIYKSMGYVIDYGHEIVTKFENFESVNIPLTHPATESHDTIYLNEKDMIGENLILRTHNSAHQVEDILKHGVPLKLGSPGRVYRFENMDASHDVMFQYAEGIVVDKNISIAQFKDSMKKFLSAILGREITIRLRPSFFPFVEPGFEIDAQCPICTGKGCSLCKQSGRIELLGAGMVHPNVIKNANLDPEIWSGFARGIGVSRLAAIKYGIKDIRYFTNGDLRFCRSF